jgi:two-component system sensor histidine kinase KdpD
MATINRTRALRAAATATAEAKAEVLRTAILDGLAHEFKTPLAVILAASEGLEEAGNLTPVQRELAAEITSEVMRLSELTSSLLNRNETDYEELKPRMTDLNLSRFLSSVVETFARRHTERDVRFIHNEADSICVEGDKELLRLVVSQLLDNAVKYSMPESSITVSLGKASGRIEVRIQNTGSSIPPTEQEMVFQRFYRGDRHRYVMAGSGLGLYVARRIAIAHGGTLTVDATGARDDETTLLMTLPLMERNTPDGVSLQSVGCR